MRVRFFSQRISIVAATSRTPASTMRLTPPLTDNVVRPLITNSTISVPTSALATEPLPPPRLMPPSTVAVRTVTSRPTPTSPPTVPSRAAKNSAPIAVSTPLAT